MPTLTSPEFYIGELSIPNATVNPVMDRLTTFIARYEPKFLADILGYELFVLLNEEVSDRISDLKDGVVYIDSSGRTVKWEGLVNDAEKKSLVANYIYYIWQEVSAAHSTGVGTGVAKKDAIIPVSPADKMLFAWNEMAESIKNLLVFLYDAKDEDGVRVYPEFQISDLYRVAKRYRSNNFLGF